MFKGCFIPFFQPAKIGESKFKSSQLLETVKRYIFLENNTIFSMKLHLTFERIHTNVSSFNVHSVTRTSILIKSVNFWQKLATNWYRTWYRTKARFAFNLSSNLKMGQFSVEIRLEIGVDSKDAELKSDLIICLFILVSYLFILCLFIFVFYGLCPSVSSLIVISTHFNTFWT